MAMYDFGMKRAVVENTLVGPMKGGLYENLVATMLAANGVPLRYWMSANGNREIEFLAESDGAVGPIEVKASRNRSISLDTFCNTMASPRGTSSSTAMWAMLTRRSRFPTTWRCSSIGNNRTHFS